MGGGNIDGSDMNVAGSDAMPAQPAGGGWRRDMTLDSERGVTRLFTEDLLEQLGVHGWSPAESFAIHLAAEEALVNAIVHGNQLDPAKRVHVACEVSADRVWLEISDEGDGFDPGSVPDCTLEDRLDVPSGRGVMLMRSFMTRIEYNEKGNSVVLEKLRDPEA
jgi:serine/threonine-protein kinase RsbW